MQAGNGTSNIQIIETTPGPPDGTGGYFPDVETTVLDTRCSYKQISSQVTIQAYQIGTNEVFEVRFRKRNGFSVNASIQHAVLFGNKYAIKRPWADKRDHVLTLIKRK